MIREQSIIYEMGNGKKKNVDGRWWMEDGGWMVYGR